MKVVILSIFCKDSEDINDFAIQLIDSTRDFINKFGLVEVARNDIECTVKNYGQTENI